MRSSLVYDNLEDGRDLKTVEKDLARSSDEKEAAYNAINNLNNEQKSLNEKISRITNTAAAAERTAREKEELYKREQEASKRKNELNEQLQKCSAREKELEKQVSSFFYKVSSFIMPYIMTNCTLSQYVMNAFAYTSSCLLDKNSCKQRLIIDACAIPIQRKTRI